MEEIQVGVSGRCLTETSYLLNRYCSCVLVPMENSNLQREREREREGEREREKKSAYTALLYLPQKKKKIMSADGQKEL